MESILYVGMDVHTGNYTLNFRRKYLKSHAILQVTDR